MDKKVFRITETHGNSRNRIPGSRIRFWNKAGEKVAEMVVPCNYGKRYYQIHPSGQYGRRYYAILQGQ